MNNKKVEAIIRAKVEGQLRGFLKEHPSILEAVIWFPTREDKVTTFVNSLAKRIVNDLTSPSTLAELSVALLGDSGSEGDSEAMAHHSVAAGGESGIMAALPVPQSFETNLSEVTDMVFQNGALAFKVQICETLEKYGFKTIAQLIMSQPIPERIKTERELLDK
jgi:hypothetical protein